MSNEFSGCTVMSCARKVRKEDKKVYANYIIEKTCRYAQTDICTYKSMDASKIGGGECYCQRV